MHRQSPIDRRTAFSPFAHLSPPARLDSASSDRLDQASPGAQASRDGAQEAARTQVYRKSILQHAGLLAAIHRQLESREAAAAATEDDGKSSGEKRVRGVQKKLRQAHALQEV